MKSGRLISCLLALLLLGPVLIVGGCGNGEDDGFTGSSAGFSSQVAKSGSSTYWSLWEKNKVLEGRNRDLQDELNRERKKSSDNEAARKKAERDKNVIVAVIIGVVLMVVALIAAFIVVMIFRHPVSKQTRVSADSCPLCGWKRTPGEPVCRNCHTHF